MTLGDKYKVIETDGRQRLSPEHEAGKLVGSDVIVVDRRTDADLHVVLGQGLRRKVKVTRWRHQRWKIVKLVALLHDKPVKLLWAEINASSTISIIIIIIIIIINNQYTYNVATVVLTSLYRLHHVEDGLNSVFIDDVTTTRPDSLPF